MVLQLWLLGALVLPAAAAPRPIVTSTAAPSTPLSFPPATTQPPQVRFNSGAIHRPGALEDEEGPITASWGMNAIGDQYGDSAIGDEGWSVLKRAVFPPRANGEGDGSNPDDSQTTDNGPNQDDNETTDSETTTESDATQSKTTVSETTESKTTEKSTTSEKSSTTASTTSEAETTTTDSSSTSTTTQSSTARTTTSTASATSTSKPIPNGPSTSGIVAASVFGAFVVAAIAFIGFLYFRRGRGAWARRKQERARSASLKTGVPLLGQDAATKDVLEQRQSSQAGRESLMFSRTRSPSLVAVTYDGADHDGSANDAPLLYYRDEAQGNYIPLAHMRTGRDRTLSASRVSTELHVPSPTDGRRSRSHSLTQPPPHSRSRSGSDAGSQGWDRSSLETPYDPGMPTHGRDRSLSGGPLGSHALRTSAIPVVSTTPPSPIEPSPIESPSSHRYPPGSAL